MSTANGFHVELVEAITKQPFKEHVKDGQRYVKVEPDAEYFIRIERVHKSKTGTVGADVGKVYVNFEVDGEDLGYHNHSKFLSYSGTSGDDSSPLGTVVVKFYKAVEDGLKEVKDFQSNVPSCELDASSLSGGITKAVRSGLGSESHSQQVAKTQMLYKKGRHLETVTLRYATALGLIHVGILPQPPLWEQARLNNPSDGHIDPELANIVPILVHNDAVVAHGVTLSQGMQWELFDLTHL